MSKLDAQRAMREAKYARDSSSGPTRREAAAAADGYVGRPGAEATSAPCTAPRLLPSTATTSAATGR